MSNPDLDEDYFEHKTRYHAARKEYQKYSKLELPDDVLCFSVDMQKIMIPPHMPGYKSAIFMSRLVAYNETFVPVSYTHLTLPTIYSV